MDIPILHNISLHLHDFPYYFFFLLASYLVHTNLFFIYLTTLLRDCLVAGLEVSYANI